MNNEKFVDTLLEKVEGIINNVPDKGIDWGIFAILVQIALAFIPLSKSINSKESYIQEHERNVRYSSRGVGRIR